MRHCEPLQFGGYAFRGSLACLLEQGLGGATGHLSGKLQPSQGWTGLQSLFPMAHTQGCQPVAPAPCHIPSLWGSRNVLTVWRLACPEVTAA